LCSSFSDTKYLIVIPVFHCFLPLWFRVEHPLANVYPALSMLHSRMTITIMSLISFPDCSTHIIFLPVHMIPAMKYHRLVLLMPAMASMGFLIILCPEILDLSDHWLSSLLQVVLL